MPYVKEEDRISVQVEGNPPKAVGDINCFFYCQFLLTFFANKRYATIAEIKTRKEIYIEEFYNKFWDGWWNKVQVSDAFDLAYLEFYIRYGRPYEEEAIKKNGDILVEEREGKLTIVRTAQVAVGG